MIKNIIIDNFLKDKEFFTVLKKELLHSTGHFFQEISNFDYKKLKHKTGESRFYSSDLNYEEEIAHRFLVHKVCTRLDRVLKPQHWRLIRMYINVQHTGMEGYWHTDSNADITAILMLNGSGSFSIKENDKIKEIEFVPNRLIMFDSLKTHKGNKPDGKTPRMTLAIKLKKHV